MQSPPDLEPREPEIEFLGRLARLALRGLRALLWCVGVVAITVAVISTGWPGLLPEFVFGPGYYGLRTEDVEVTPVTARIAHNMVWVCAGWPLLLPARWLFGRGRWIGLVIGCASWFGPMVLAGDHPYGFVIRMFATFVACTSLLVLKVLAGLGPAR